MPRGIDDVDPAIIPVDGRLRRRFPSPQTESSQSPFHNINADTESFGHSLLRDTLLEPSSQQDLLAGLNLRAASGA